MVFYIAVIALVNMGIGFALAVSLARQHRSPLLEDVAGAPQATVSPDHPASPPDATLSAAAESDAVVSQGTAVPA